MATCFVRQVQRPSLSLTRSIHQTSSQSYQINYERLRSGRNTTEAPRTVKGNVKNVVGWRGGAERGFLAAYPDCIHVLTKEGTADIPDISKWYRKVLTHNLSTNVLKQRYGILVPITFKQLNPGATKDEMTLAHVLGWCVEMIRAAAIVTTDTVSGNHMRYGIRRTKDNPTWAEKHNLGNKAFNDALLIERGVFVLLKHYFGREAATYYEPITHAQRLRALGRTLGHSIINDKEGERLKDYNIKNYKMLAKSHVSQTNYCLPISLALHLAGMHEEKLHQLAHVILHEMGYYVEVNRDFAQCFIETSGTDIQDGRLTWLIVLALQRANFSQREILDANYGLADAHSVKEVKQIYNDLKLKKLLAAHAEEKKDEILNRIQGISKLDKAGLSQEFFFKLLENMDMNNIS